MGSLVAVFVLLTVSIICSYLAYRSWDDGLTDDQRAEIANKKAFKKAAKRETKYLIKQIPKEFAIQNRLQYALAQKTGTAGKRKIARVKLRDACIKSTEVWFPLNSRDFPYGVGYHDILNENKNVVNNLEHGIRRSCRVEVDPTYKDVYLVVGFRNSLGGLPLMVRWEKVIAALGKRDRFSVVLGINKAGKIVKQNLTRWPHGLVLGGTGNGKTTFIKQAFITLIGRNTPEDLQFTLIDLKRTEFWHFKDVPHVVRYVDKPDDAIEALGDLVNEMDRRYDKMKDVATDIDAWNKRRPGQRFPRHFMWCDELALLTRGGDNERRRNAIKLILRLVALGRGAGINVLLGTQSVNKETITMDITANIDGRICYGVRNTNASILAIGNGDAVGLRPAGRCAIVEGSDTRYLQSPYASDEQIQEAVKRAKRGEFGRLEAKPGLEPIREFAEIAKHALNHHEGRLELRPLFDDLRGRISWDRLVEILKANDGRMVEIDGKQWIVKPPAHNGFGMVGRSLVPGELVNELGSNGHAKEPIGV